MLRTPPAPATLIVLIRVISANKLMGADGPCDAGITKATAWEEKTLASLAPRVSQLRGGDPSKDAEHGRGRAWSLPLLPYVSVRVCVSYKASGVNFSGLWLQAQRCPVGVDVWAKCLTLHVAWREQRRPLLRTRHNRWRVH